MQKSMVLLEVIVSLVLFSIIAIVSAKMVFSLAQKTQQENFYLEQNLLLETTRLFLSKQNSLSTLSKVDDTLYFDTHLLLQNISTYEGPSGGAIQTIRICLYNDTICQVWKIKTL